MGILSKIVAWGKHPTVETDAEPVDWLLGLGLVIVFAFLWSRVVRQIINN